MTEEVKKKKAAMHEFYHKYGDPWIWGIFIALFVISVIENYSASSRNVANMGVYMPFIKHTAFLLGGGVITYLIARRDFNKPLFLGAAIPLLAVVTVLSLTYVMLCGEVINGARRAISLPGFSFQPAELSKLSIVTLLSFIIAKFQRNKGLTNVGIIWAFVSVGIYCGLMVQSGLTNCLILGAICVSMLLIGGAPFKKILLGFTILGVLGGCAYIIKSMGDKNDEMLAEAETQKAVLVADDADNHETVTVTNNASLAPEKNKEPEKDKVNRWGMRMKRMKQWWYNDSLVYWPVTSKNQQEMISRMAQAHGGVIGVGVGRSRECARLPLAFSDYIYSIIIEETGLVGGIIVLLLYLSLLGRATIIVRKCHRALPSMLIIGLAALITLQALFHMAINTGVFPVSGQPLPLISNGGTAIIAISAAFGIMLSVSRTIAVNRDASNNARLDVDLPEELNAENPIEITEITPKNIWK